MYVCFSCRRNFCASSSAWEPTMCAQLKRFTSASRHSRSVAASGRSRWKQVVKEFAREAGGWFFTAEKLMWHRPVGSNAVMPLLFFCCVHRSSDSQCFSVCRTTPKILNPHLVHSSLDLPKAPTQTASRSVMPFLQGSRTWPTDRHTDRPRYSVCSSRPHPAVAAMRSSKPNVY